MNSTCNVLSWKSSSFLSDDDGFPIEMIIYIHSLGDLIHGDEAQQLGLVLKAVDEKEVFSQAFEIAKKIAGQSPIGNIII
jgi:hypothetical protein